MAYLTQYNYYENNGQNPESENWGSYQYVPLDDIVNNFMLMNMGNNNLINNEERYRVRFHAKRAIQELNYDAFKETKVLQLTLDDTIRFVLPSDYVNWIRISEYRNGILYPLSENIQTNYANAYLQDNNARILFDENGEALSPEFSNIDLDRIDGSAKSLYLNDGHQFDGMYGYLIDNTWYFDTPFGLNTETANANPTFKIDKKSGVINFSSARSGSSMVVEYVSDGMENGDDSKVSVNKMFEDYVYASIEYEILDRMAGVQEYVVRRAQKKRRALLMNAKIRISNIHAGRLLMNMRGQDKWIK
ncbi:MAG: putative structural protein [Prokaryotic dsDNA virus sp.]|nr:MAG: putative structural protein [Prokaryotic dsDNA virus sp.]|tara:strand:- start:11287 stop:12198 length:912 start_codon:yes stop_codon:yes gene_type:complete